jgi:hypothetical protein
LSRRDCAPTPEADEFMELHETLSVRKMMQNNEITDAKTLVWPLFVCYIADT